jgi:hypothetical protein
MADDRQERIRQRAHAIWEREGRPHGDHERHWHQASADIDAEDAASAAPNKRASAKPKAAAKPKGADAALAAHTKDAAKPKRRSVKAN